MTPTDAALEKIYEKDSATGTFVIAAALERSSDFFNELDPSPIRRRDLDDDLRVFLEDCSSDIPLSQDIIARATSVVLCAYVPLDFGDTSEGVRGFQPQARAMELSRNVVYFIQTCAIGRER